MGISDIFRRGSGRSVQVPTSTEAILESLRRLSAEQFEERLRDVLGEAGYAVDFHGGEGSSEADLVLRRRGERTLLQYRHWNLPRVPYRSVRDLYELMQQEGAAGCTLVTCGIFEHRAIEFAQMKPIDLINGPLLLKRMPGIISEPVGTDLAADIKTSFQPMPSAEPHNPLPLGSTTHAGEEIQAPSSLSISQDVDEEQGDGPLCPRCKGSMSMRTAGIGGAAGHHFWACDRFPGCKGTRPI